MRNSIDAEKVNRPRLVAGIEWKLAVMIVMTCGMLAMQTRSFGPLIVALLLMVFLSGASRNDPMAVRAYLAHSKQRERYSPVPQLRKALINRRPLGYGQNDLN
jgi:type IV secretory pathway VirB3-like protein